MPRFIFITRLVTGDACCLPKNYSLKAFLVNPKAPISFTRPPTTKLISQFCDKRLSPIKSTARNQLLCHNCILRPVPYRPCLRYNWLINSPKWTCAFCDRRQSLSLDDKRTKKEPPPPAWRVFAIAINPPEGIGLFISRNGRTSCSLRKSDKKKLILSFTSDEQKVEFLL